MLATPTCSGITPARRAMHRQDRPKAMAIWSWRSATATPIAATADTTSVAAPVRVARTTVSACTDAPAATAR